MKAWYVVGITRSRMVTETCKVGDLLADSKEQAEEMAIEAAASVPQKYWTETDTKADYETEYADGPYPVQPGDKIGGVAQS